MSMESFPKRIPRSPDALVRPRATIEPPVPVLDLLVKARAKAEESRPKPTLSSQRQRVLDYCLQGKDSQQRSSLAQFSQRGGYRDNRSGGDSMEQGANAEVLAFSFLAPQFKEVLSNKITDPFVTSMYDDVLGGHDVAAFIQNTEGKSGIFTVDVTSSTEMLGEKVKRLLIGERTGNESTRRLFSPQVKRGLYLSEDTAAEIEEGTIETVSGMSHDEQGNPFTLALPLVSYVDSATLASESTVSKDVLKGARDLFGFQLFIQARLLQAYTHHILNGRQPGTLFGKHISNEEFLEALNVTSDGASVDVAYLAYIGETATALKTSLLESLVKRHGSLKNFLHLFDQDPEQRILDTDMFEKVLLLHFPDQKLAATRLATIKLARLLQEYLPAASRQFPEIR